MVYSLKLNDKDFSTKNHLILITNNGDTVDIFSCHHFFIFLFFLKIKIIPNMLVPSCTYLNRTMNCVEGFRGI